MNPSALEQHVEHLTERVDAHDDDFRELKQLLANHTIDMVTRLGRSETKLDEVLEKVGDTEVRNLRLQLRAAQAPGKRFRRLLWALAGAGGGAAAAFIVEHLLPAIFKLFTGGHP